MKEMGKNHSKEKTQTKTLPSIPDSKEDDTLNVEDVTSSSTKSPPSVKNLCPTVLRKKGYSIGSKFASGGFSSVHNATYTNPTTHETQDMAVKITKFAEIEKEFKERSLKNELKIVNKIKHPHIARVYEVTKTKNHSYIFMEKCTGSVQDYIQKRQKHLSERRARSWFHQLLEAIEYVHKKQIAHRDLKLDNLLLDSQNKIKLTDFGFAFFLKSANRKDNLAATQCGTQEYWAPEIAMSTGNSTYDPQKADMWSCGIILYELLTARMPFPRYDENSPEDAKRNLEMKRKKQWHYPPHINVSKEAKNLNSNLLEPLPSDRPTASEAKAHKWFKIKLSNTV